MENGSTAHLGTKFVCSSHLENFDVPSTSETGLDAATQKDETKELRFKMAGQIVAKNTKVSREIQINAETNVFIFP